MLKHITLTEIRHNSGSKQNSNNTKASQSGGRIATILEALADRF